MRLAAALLALLLPLPVVAETRHSLLDWAELSGWAEDDHAAAMAVFAATCGDMDDADWRPVCGLAKEIPEGDAAAARAFFEMAFRPVLIEDGAPALFTGYFEPELRGSRTRTTRYRYPLYARPPGLPSGRPWLSRAEIEGGALSGLGLELAWVDDAVDAFFLQIQGSGRIALAEGGTMRVGYAAHNGHDYRSVGQEMIRRGLIEPTAASMGTIRNWVRGRGEEGYRMLRHNPSFVFFREVSEVPADRGPLGAMNRSITAGRTVAIDPAHVPLGAPVWVEKEGRDPMRRLMVAQDTGSAIKGAQRADIFYGTGGAAGKEAGAVRDPGRMVVLMPIRRAFALAPDEIS